MSFIAAPAMRIRSFKPSLKRPSQINQAAYTGQRSVMSLPWYGQWTFSVQLAPIIGEANIRAHRSFLARCRGAVNTFRLPVTEGPQNANSGAKVASDAVAGSTTLAVNMAPSALLEGQYFTVNGQLCCCTADMSGNTLTFEPPLRQAATTGTPVVTSRPYALVYMVSDDLGYSVDAGQLYGVSFDVAEAILGTDGVTIPETELVTNGTFATDESSWIGSGATLSNASGKMRVTATSAGFAASYQQIAVIPGKSYTLKGDIVNGLAGGILYCANSVGGASITTVLAGSITGGSTTFTPTVSPIYLHCQLAAHATSDYADFDNISLMEA